MYVLQMQTQGASNIGQHSTEPHSLGEEFGAGVDLQEDASRVEQRLVRGNRHGPHGGRLAHLVGVLAQRILNFLHESTRKLTR